MSDNMTGIHLPEHGDCAFCDYIAGRRDYTFVVSDELTATLVTREQRGISHLLVTTIRHAPTIIDLTGAESGAVMSALRTAARAIDLTFARPGIAIWQNNGRSAHQDVPHFHFHVAGTLPGGGTDFGDVPELSLSETESIAAKLRPTFALFSEIDL